ncbi:erythronate-4-phosphate dehydrogenase [Longibacter salinarum]|uniref:Erythronate-4-phosphate dehydrogenase n=1 Tax=Longibacter salinarum TaxID=1850348 RepID=A0A2A8D0C5_9BACT|nr:4-phosphoerythronate dehydrogenase [Longibacter salinarum]PEN14376.1 erythronate-4-phosphate dehydrogenase [Longibacter salinarum]
MPTLSLSVLADENIPLASEAFGSLGTVQTLPGRAIERADLMDIDALFVRSVTTVGPELLSGTPVRFVGSATIGTDHIDQEWLQNEGIAFAHAPASNADSVADYVVAIALHLALKTDTSLADRTAGIIGCGNTGSRVAARLRALGANVLQNDPPLAEEADKRGEDHPYVSLDHVLEKANLISLHTPLTTHGPHPTHHLFNGDRIGQLQKETWLINTSRGAVIDNQALSSCLRAPRANVTATALDVWENEPTPDAELLRHVDLSTPHVAGYAFDGKVRGTSMLYHAFCEFLDIEPAWSPDAALAPARLGALRLSPPDARLPRTEYLDALARQACDVAADHHRLQKVLDVPPDERGAYFSRLRKTYPKRREMQMHSVSKDAVPEAYHEFVRDGLQITLVDDVR